jgi:hypothetical protein
MNQFDVRCRQMAGSSGSPRPQLIASSARNSSAEGTFSRALSRF